jgi:hypothetical protein
LILETPGGPDIDGGHLWVTDLEGSYLQRDAWPHLVTPGMTISVRQVVQELVLDNATRGQDNPVYVKDDDGVQHTFAYQSCKRWQVCLAPLPEAEVNDTPGPQGALATGLRSLRSERQ